MFYVVALSVAPLKCRSFAQINLGRAARTDAGVHAAGNVVSAKIITSIPDRPDFVAAINAELPPEIRIWGCVRVQNSFSART